MIQIFDAVIHKDDNDDLAKIYTNFAQTYKILHILYCGEETGTSGEPLQNIKFICRKRDDDYTAI